MFKYVLTIDGDMYIALFLNAQEAMDFIHSNIDEGSTVTVVNYKYVTPIEVLEDTSMEYAYRVEMASIFLVPNHKQYKKWYELESVLKNLGYLF